ncbi:MAG: transcription termination factor NusA [bacterium]
MSQSAIQAAIQQICQEKNLSEESVLRTIESALAAAFRKDFGNKLQNIVANFDPKTGKTEVFDVKTVVEDLPEEAEVEEIEDETERKPFKARAEAVETELSEDELAIKKFNPRTEIQLKDAKELDKKHKLGDEIITPLEITGEFGRMAAQTAKQVIIQKIREEERQNIFDEYKVLEHQVINGTVQRREGRNVLVDLGHTVAVLPPEEQVDRERYNIGNRMKFYLKEVEQTTRGPRLVLSRVSTEVVKRIFETEIPEVANGVIDIKAVAREAGSRTKVAITSNDENIDPIGSCVGQRGTRIQTIIAELNGEKIDIILWDEDAVKFIINGLSPAKVISVELSDISEERAEKIATVKVKDDQLSLAIGKAGQNVRLASRLTGWKIDIISDGGEKVDVEAIAEAEAETTDEVKSETETPAKTEETTPTVETAEVEETVKEETTQE